MYLNPIKGLKAVVKKDFCASVKKMNPDVILLQETKTSLTNQPSSEIAEKLKEWKYRHYHDCTEKKGYAGKIFSY